MCFLYTLLQNKFSLLFRWNEFHYRIQTIERAAVCYFPSPLRKSADFSWKSLLFGLASFCCFLRIAKSKQFLFSLQHLLDGFFSEFFYVNFIDIIAFYFLGGVFWNALFPFIHKSWKQSTAKVMLFTHSSSIPIICRLLFINNFCHSFSRNKQYLLFCDMQQQKKSATRYTL